MTIIRKQNDIAAASNADLVETFNELTGKSIKKFESRAIAEVRVANAILSAQNAAGHVGVPKGTDPEAKTVAELEAAATTRRSAKPADDNETKEDDDMTRTKKATTVKKKGAPASAKTKTTAKKDAPANGSTGGARARVLTAGARVLIAVPKIPRRPQEGSNRTKVLEALKKRKDATLEKLSEDVGFDARSYVSQLVRLGWATIKPAA